jgi:hypothetical protein
MTATAPRLPAAWSSFEPADPAARLEADPSLGEDLILHLDRQLTSARRLAQIVSAQAGAIRRRAVREVVAAAGELSVEMHRREGLEGERLALIERAAELLGVPREVVVFSAIVARLDPERAQTVIRLTEELTGLLVLIDREHELNRRLMAQELAFLDHLLGLAGTSGSYAAPPLPGSSPVHSARLRRNPTARRRVFDVEA